MSTVISIFAIDYLDGLVSEATFSPSSAMLNSTPLLTLIT